MRPDPDLVARGRRTVRVSAGVLVALSLLSVVLSATMVGVEQLPRDAVRLAIMSVLAVGLIGGRAWARWITVAALVVALIGAVIAAVTGVLHSAGLLGWAFWSVYATAYVAIIRVLVWSADGQAFFAATSQPASIRPRRRTAVEPPSA